MKTISKILSTGVAALIISAAAQATPVTVNVDASFEGLAISNTNQSVLGAGVIEFGWLNPGTSEAMIDSFFAGGDLASIDSVFNTVGTIPFSLVSPNSFAPGLIFDSINVVSDHLSDPTGFAAYKNATTGAAGKQGFLWIRDSAGLGSTTEMAFVDTGFLFPTANDTVLFADFATSFDTSTNAISSSNVWIGNLAPVQIGGGVDLSQGGTADGVGAFGGTSVLETAAVAAVPEPGTAAFALIGLLGLAARRHRNKVA